MKKRSKVWITVGAIAGVMLIAAAVLFGQYYSQGKLVTDKPVQILTVNRNSSVSADVQALNPVTIQNVVVVNGVESPLLASFQDDAKAMQAVKKADADFLGLMKKKWNLDDLNASNWKTYYQHADPYVTGKLPDDLGGDRSYDQLNLLDGFFEIYEDEEDNQEVLSYLQTANWLFGAKLIRQISLDPIVFKFPEGAPILERYRQASGKTNPLAQLVNCQVTSTPESNLIDGVAAAVVVALVIFIILRKKAAKKRNNIQSSKAE